MKAILVNTKDKGIQDLSTCPTRRWVLELCENREFETFDELQNLLRVADVSEEAYKRGLGCPADAKRALKLINAAPKIQWKTAVVTSKESGKKVYEDCRELAKQGRIIYYTMPEEPCTGRNFWMAEVVISIKY